MILTSVHIRDLRNIQTASIDLHRRHNLFVGANGAGKTSVLEAVHLLGYGRSFRTRISRDLIRESCAELVVSCGFQRQDLSLGQAGVRKDQLGQSELRMDGQPLSSAAELAAEFPLIAIESTTSELLLGGPADRRQALDWGVFHVEHSFAHAWKLYRRNLAQRNALLKSGAADADLEPWTVQLVEQAETIHQMRRTYFEALNSLFLEELIGLAPELNGLTMHYDPGWNLDKGLSQVLKERLDRDHFDRRTGRGAHAANLRFLAGASEARDRYSRGQIKQVAIAFKCAQAKLYNAGLGRSCVLLLDDLAAELDPVKHLAIIEMFDAIGCQTLQTYTDMRDLDALHLDPHSFQMFHVKQGAVAPVQPEL